MVKSFFINCQKFKESSVATDLSLPGNLSLNNPSRRLRIATSDFFGFRKRDRNCGYNLCLPIGNETTHGNNPKGIT